MSDDKAAIVGIASVLIVVVMCITSYEIISMLHESRPAMTECKHENFERALCCDCGERLDYDPDTLAEIFQLNATIKACLAEDVVWKEKLESANARYAILKASCGILQRSKGDCLNHITKLEAEITKLRREGDATTD